MICVGSCDFSKTGDIFNDDNKYNKSGIIGYNGTSNDDYYPPAEPKKKGNTGSSKKGNSKAGAWGAIIVLAIIIFIVLHAVNTYYNMQVLEYFDNRVKEAQERVDQLESQGYGPASTNMAIFTKAYGQEEQGFEITQERIDVMNTAAEFIKIID
ncbi:MAG: hypothetical protein ACXWE7_11595, partial [Nitrososphaeraceae archaeon]